MEEKETWSSGQRHAREATRCSWFGTEDVWLPGLVFRTWKLEHTDNGLETFATVPHHNFIIVIVDGHSTFLAHEASLGFFIVIISVILAFRQSRISLAKQSK